MQTPKDFCRPRAGESFVGAFSIFYKDGDLSPRIDALTPAADPHYLKQLFDMVASFGEFQIKNIRKA
jgi:hypothetical protein